jgi:hypothetical protein
LEIDRYALSWTILEVNIFHILKKAGGSSCLFINQLSFVYWFFFRFLLFIRSFTVNGSFAISSLNPAPFPCALAAFAPGITWFAFRFFAIKSPPDSGTISYKSEKMIMK